MHVVPRGSAPQPCACDTARGNEGPSWLPRSFKWVPSRAERGRIAALPLRDGCWSPSQKLPHAFRGSDRGRGALCCSPLLTMSLATRALEPLPGGVSGIQRPLAAPLAQGELAGFLGGSSAKARAEELSSAWKAPPPRFSEPRRKGQRSPPGRSSQPLLGVAAAASEAPVRPPESPGVERWSRSQGAWSWARVDRRVPAPA